MNPAQTKFKKRVNSESIIILATSNSRKRHLVAEAAVATYVLDVSRQIPWTGAEAAEASCAAVAGASCGSRRIPCPEAGAECQPGKQKMLGTGRFAKLTIGGMPIIMGGIIGGGGI
jgi:hypothetical protein